jgi:hypothetical protein
MRKMLVAILTAVVVGCGGGANASPVAPTASPVEPTASPIEPIASPIVPTASPVAAATPTEAPTAEPLPTQPAAFASTLYPYTWELPAGTLTRNWKPATLGWDGLARVGNESRVVDIVGTADGNLLIWGLPWTGDLKGFSDLVKANAARFHRCSAVGDPSGFEVSGLASLAQRDACANEYADVAGVHANSLRAVMVKDGYGLAFRMILNPGKEAVALDDLIDWLDGLTWTAGT